MSLLLLTITIFLSFLTLLVGAIYYLRLPRGTSTKTFVGLTVGHRGCRWIQEDCGTRQIPENTLSSFKKAVTHGCKAVELDCRLTKDGHVVVMHDDIISRVCTVDKLVGTITDEKGAESKVDKVFISDMTLAEVKTLRYKNWDTTETIPTLEEVISWARDANVKVFVELKSLSYDESKLLAEQVCAIMTKIQAWKWCCIIAFNPVAVYYVRKIQPKIETCILYCNDFFQWGIVHKAERQYWWTSLFAYPLDVFLVFLATTSFIPWFTGCTMIGPDINLLSKLNIKQFQTNTMRGSSKGLQRAPNNTATQEEMAQNSHLCNDLDIYCWVANTMHEFDFYLNQNCSVGTDFVFPVAILPEKILHAVHSANMQPTHHSTSPAQTPTSTSSGTGPAQYNGKFVSTMTDYYKSQLTQLENAKFAPMTPTMTQPQIPFSPQPLSPQPIAQAVI